MQSTSRHAGPKNRFWLGILIASCALVAAGCGDGQGSGLVLFVDAEYDPAAISDTSAQLHETSLLVAQTFTVLEDGKFERFDIVLTQGTPGSEGTVRIDIRPLLPSGEPEPDDTNSIIDPLDVDSTELPLVGIEDFTIFDVGDQPNREVLAGEEFAIVVSFVGRSAGTVSTPIAFLLGRTGDEYADGTGFIDLDGLGFVVNTFDYFFRTFSLR